MEWLLKKLGDALKKISIDEYNRIKAENKKYSEYQQFVALMEAVAKAGQVRCESDKSSPCPIAVVLYNFYDPNPVRTTNGTTTYRVWTIVGSDKQTINVQTYDLSEAIIITVQHADGTYVVESVQPQDAMNWIKREVALAH